MPTNALPDDVSIPKKQGRVRRRSCESRDRVFGDTIALTRYPHKLIWFEKYPSELYDLSWDPQERSDRAAYQRELVASLEGELAEIRRRSGLEGEGVPEPSPGAVEALEGLGYVE